MASTLREQHAVRQARRINETSRTMGRRMLEEQAAQRLVLEALDADRLEQAAGVLQKLQAIDFGEMAYFKQAVSAAVGDVNKALGGNASKEGMASALSKLMGAAKEKLGAVVKNPIPNALAFASALENAFGQTARLVTASIPKDTLKTTDHEKLKAAQVRKLLGQNVDAVHGAIAKAFQPKGILARLGVTWKKRYVDPSEAAWAILNARLGDVITVVKSIRQGPQASNIADELTADQGQQKPGNDASGSGEQGGAAQQVDQDAKDELVSKLAGITDVASTDVEKVIDTLLKRGMLRVKE